MIKKIIDRVKLDWAEYWYYKNKERTRKRTERSLQTAVDMALTLNKLSGRTYYIFINANHVPEPMTRMGIKNRQRMGEFPKDWRIDKILEHAIIIVQSQNEIIRHQRVENNESIMKKLEE